MKSSDKDLNALDKRLLKKYSFNIIESHLTDSSSLFVLGSSKFISEKISEKILKTVKKDPVVISANCMFDYNGKLHGITDEFGVKLNFDYSENEFKKFIKKFTIEIVEQYNFSYGEYTLRLPKTSDKDLINIVNELYFSGNFEFSEPNFISFDVLNSNDPLYENQWSLENSGQSNGTIGADIDIRDAWKITRGNPNIKIAVLDNGVDSGHPDLVPNLLPGHDATDFGLEPDSDEWHGTAVAGIIAAKRDNNIGIAGVAPECKIIPVVIIGGFGGDEITRDGIDWAWKNGADVINISAGTSTPSSKISGAIARATDCGRNGLGSIVVVAAGNNNLNTLDFTFPANLSTVIAVGASNMCDERKRSGTDPMGVSCDMDNDWGSNFGQGLSVVAPGIQITTTDITGTEGNNPGDYMFDFSGTSGSAPHVSGVAALILSINKNLTWQEVKRIIEINCDKVGDVAYALTLGNPNGTWNNEMGYGRVNACRAINYTYLSTVVIEDVSQPNTPIQTSSPGPWIFINECRFSPIASAYYIASRFNVSKTINFPYTRNPRIVGTATGLGFADPNYSSFWMDNYLIGQASPNTTRILSTNVYFLTAAVSGQQVGYVPIHPDNVTYFYTVLEDSNEKFLQNEIVDMPISKVKAVQNLEAGFNVTNLFPFGNYVIDNGGDVEIVAGREIRFAPGFEVEKGGKLNAYILNCEGNN